MLASSSFRLVCVAALLVASLSPSHADAGHPLDALSADEINQVISVLLDNGKVDDQTRYPFISILEPSKNEVLSWKAGQPFSRQAQVTVKNGSETYEAEIDLRRNAIRQWKHTDDVQPVILG